METITTQTPPTYECPAGLRYHNGAAALWVRSPRTGHTAIVPAGKFPTLPGRVVGRITQAASVGRRLVWFTREELVAIAEATKVAVPTPSPAAPVEPEACVRRSFWGTPAMSKADVAPTPIAPASVESAAVAEPSVQRLPATIGMEGIHNHPFLCITLPDRSLVIHRWELPRLPAGLIDRVKAATEAGEALVDFTADELSAVGSVQAAAEKAIAANTGIARSTRARGR